MNKINSKEIETVSNLTPFDRYKYFIKKLADNETFYTLQNSNGEFVLSTLEDKSLFPVWNYIEFANLCLIDEWKESNVVKFSLEDFQDEIIDVIYENQYLINVFPVGNKTGFVVDLEEFVSDLKNELDNY